MEELYRWAHNSRARVPALQAFVVHYSHSLVYLGAVTHETNHSGTKQRGR